MQQPPIEELLTQLLEATQKLAVRYKQIADSLAKLECSHAAEVAKNEERRKKHDEDSKQWAEAQQRVERFNADAIAKAEKQQHAYEVEKKQWAEDQKKLHEQLGQIGENKECHAGIG
jgi:hypothetical protein